MSKVKPKKHLGQHFLLDEGISHRIASSLTFHGDYQMVLEVGPGTGALTKHLIPLAGDKLYVAEVDVESIAYLQEHYPMLGNHILGEDFLQIDLKRFGQKLCVAGNFPYNISSQILFHVLDFYDLVPEVVGMFQKEVAMRIASGPGNKNYGILSVLLQAYYDIEYLFTVDEDAFNPPPKVKSGVIRLRRNTRVKLPVDDLFFKQVVKMGFNQRRKTLRNSMKAMIIQKGLPPEHEIFSKRPEQLDVEGFIELCLLLR